MGTCVHFSRSLPSNSWWQTMVGGKSCQGRQPPKAGAAGPPLQGLPPSHTWPPRSTAGNISLAGCLKTGPQYTADWLNHHHQAIAVTYQEVFDGSAAVHGCFQSCRGNPLDALADSAMRQRIADQGMKIPPRDQQTPEALGAFQKAEIEKWWPIMKAANIKGE